MGWTMCSCWGEGSGSLDALCGLAGVGMWCFYEIPLFATCVYSSELLCTVAVHGEREDGRIFPHKRERCMIYSYAFSAHRTGDANMNTEPTCTAVSLSSVM